MLAHKHPAYEEERNNLKDTCTCLDEEIEFMTEEIDRFEEDLKKLRTTAGGNYDNEVFVKQTIFNSMKRKYRELQATKDKPYFGRIDFKELGKDEFETFYIGKTSLERRKDDKRLIIDWRAPIASLYYSGEIGDVMYTAPDGLIMGELGVKRQYEIISRELMNIFDKGLTPMDEYLQNALWQKKDNRLRDIVTTIQSEQDTIIRADKNKVIIVQGVAGSGKTTIVLHRIAYLMYTYQEVFTPDKLLILVPNKLFMNYISDVLPDLGVEEITQLTFEDLSFKLLEREYNLTDVEYKLIRLLDHKRVSKEYRRKLKVVSEFKGSMLFKDIIDKYLEDLVKTIVPRCDLKINNSTIYSYSEIKNMFDFEYNYLPIIQRVDRIKKYIEANIRDRVKLIQDDIEEKYDRIVENVKETINDEEELRQQLISLYDERDKKIEKLSKGISSAINRYFKEWPNVEVDNVYREIILNSNVIKKYSDGKFTEEEIMSIVEHSRNIFDRGEIEREDLAPLLYLRFKMFGLSLKGRFNHIVVDEAQDYSQLQMYILKQLSSNGSFTIVGDLSQGIHSYKGIRDWRDLIKEVFKDDETEFLTLKKCYRSTMEIMNFANQLIKRYGEGNLTLAEPVLRSGDKPFIIGKDSNDEIIKNMCKKMHRLKGEGYKSVAIICKTEEESINIYNELKKISFEDIHLITDKDNEYTGGIVVIPAYVAKGLEFDAVMVNNCTADEYPEDEIHTKLLYVALTRPLHKLFIYYVKEPSRLIEEGIKTLID